MNWYYILFILIQKLYCTSHMIPMQRRIVHWRGSKNPKCEYIGGSQEVNTKSEDDFFILYPLIPLLYPHNSRLQGGIRLLYLNMSFHLSGQYYLLQHSLPVSQSYGKINLSTNTDEWFKLYIACLYGDVSSISSGSSFFL